MRIELMYLHYEGSVIPLYDISLIYNWSYLWELHPSHTNLPSWCLPTRTKMALD
jgi:hypothetical protein